MKKAIFFDFFGVISTEIAPYWFARYFEPDEARRLKELYVAPADRGDVSATELMKNLSAISGEPGASILAEWLSMAHIDREVVDAILKLKKTHKVFLLSNAITELIRPILSSEELYPLFDRVFISAEMRVAKPSPEFFRAVLDETGISAQDAVMIDDNEKNLDGAAAVGIDGILFDDKSHALEKLFALAEQ